MAKVTVIVEVDDNEDVDVCVESVDGAKVVTVASLPPDPLKGELPEGDCESGS